MIIAPLITKQQLMQYVSLNDNIKDKDIDYHLRDVYNYDLVPILPDDMLRAIEVIVMHKYPQWNKNISYSTGDVAWLKSVDASNIGHKWFKATAASTDQQPPNTSYWTDLELMNFLEEYLHPLMAQMFYYRFYAYHGQNVVQFGIVDMADPTITRTSNQDKAARLGDISNKRNIELAKLDKKLCDVDYTFDGVRYAPQDCEDVNVKPKIKMFALGQSKFDNRFNYDRWQREDYR